MPNLDVGLNRKAAINPRPLSRVYYEILHTFAGEIVVMLTEYDGHEKKVVPRATDPFIHHLRPKRSERIQ